MCLTQKKQTLVRTLNFIIVFIIIVRLGQKGIWVSALRQKCKIMQMPEYPSKSRRSTPLTQERIHLLNELGFSWTARSGDPIGLPASLPKAAVLVEEHEAGVTTVIADATAVVSVNVVNEPREEDMPAAAPIDRISTIMGVFSRVY
jgi:hypothetical protein